MIDQELLTSFLQVCPWQPAVGFFRAVEIGYLLAHAPEPAGRCLDFGCGDGRVTQIYDTQIGPRGNRSWLGVDTDPQERALALGTGLYHDVQPEIPPTWTFDAAFSNSVLEHIDPALIPDILHTIHRGLVFGGIFLFTVPSPDFHTYLRARDLARFDAKHAIRYLWDAAEWTSQLRFAGFDTVTCSTYLSRTEVRRWELISMLTSGTLCALTGHRQRPIEIQRRLGMRRGQTMPRWAAKRLARILAYGVKEVLGHDTHYMLAARK